MPVSTIDCTVKGVVQPIEFRYKGEVVHLSERVAAGVKTLMQEIKNIEAVDGKDVYFSMEKIEEDPEKSRFEWLKITDKGDGEEKELLESGPGTLGLRLSIASKLREIGLLVKNDVADTKNVPPAPAKPAEAPTAPAANREVQGFKEKLRVAETRSRHQEQRVAARFREMERGYEQRIQQLTQQLQKASNVNGELRAVLNKKTVAMGRLDDKLAVRASVIGQLQKDVTESEKRRERGVRQLQKELERERGLHMREVAALKSRISLLAQLRQEEIARLRIQLVEGLQNLQD